MNHLPFAADWRAVRRLPTAEMREDFPELAGSTVSTIEVGSTGFFTSKETIKMRFSIGNGMKLYAQKCPLCVSLVWDAGSSERYRSPLKTSQLKQIEGLIITDASVYLIPIDSAGIPLPKPVEFSMVLRQPDGQELVFSIMAETDLAQPCDHWEARLAIKEWR